MTGPIKVLVALDVDVDEAAVQSCLPLDGEIETAGLVEGLEEGWRILQETPTDLLIVACAGYSERALFLIEGAVKQDPSRPVVVFSTKAGNGFLRRAFEMGADDFVTLPESPDNIGFVLRKAVARKQGTAVGGSRSAGPMIVVLGPKGGTGKTLVSCNLTASLAMAGKRAVLIDLDLQFGDVGLSLGLSPERTVYDLAKSGGSLDEEKLDAYLVKHASGAHVLLAPTRPDHAGLVTVELLREIYATLRQSFDFVVVDTAPGFTPEVIASIDSASDVCVVGMLDSLSLKNTKLGLETLSLMGFDPGRTKLVLNRADTKVGITYDDVVSIAGRTPDVLVPSDRNVPISVNEGVPLVMSHERSEGAKAFKSLAAIYLAGPTRPEMTLSPNGKATSLVARRRLRKAAT